jgi:hypothetical protein
MTESKHLKNGLCPECGKPLQLTLIPSCKGFANNISIIFYDLPCLACSDTSHKKWYISSKFGEIMNVLFDSGQLPIARTGILTFNRLKCVRCKDKLPKVAGTVREFSGKLSIEGITPFSLSIHAPSIQCEHCGTEQIFSSQEISSNIADATINALESANIKQQFVYPGAAG